MKKTVLLLVIAVILVPVAAHAQCDWTTGTNVTLTCGNVGIGTTTTPHPLTLSGTNGNSQLKIFNSTGTGVLSMLGYAPDNVSIGFDVDFTNGQWIARDETAAWLYKNSDRLMIMGASGTPGNLISGNAYVRVNLTNGVTAFFNWANLSTTIDGGKLTLTGGDSSITFGNGQRIYDSGNANLRLLAPTMTLDTTGGSITATPSNGLFGINTPPGVALDVAGANLRLKHSSTAMMIVEAPAASTSGILLRSGGAESAHIYREATTNDLTFSAGNVERLRLSAGSGNVGIGGAISPYERLIVRGTFGGGMAMHTGGTTTSRILTAVHDWLGQTVNMRYDGTTWIKDDASKASWATVLDSRTGEDSFTISRQAPNTTAVTQLLKIAANGDVTVTGNIAAKYQDVAEWVPATTELTAGTVVVLNAEKENEVMASAHPYDTTVAGVVSIKPGLILGEAGEGKAMIATTGRVKVRVDATKRPVKVGDLLVTSDKPGVAMVSTPVDVNGIAMHRPGTIIGKALQALPAGEGEILVLLSLQ